MRLLITGGAGSIGSNLAKLALANDVEVGRGARGRESADRKGHSRQLVTITADLVLAQDGTPWLSPSTVMAMKTGATVRLASVDAAALGNADKAQAVLTAWFDDLRPVRVQAAATAPRPTGVGVGCFFSSAPAVPMNELHLERSVAEGAFKVVIQKSACDIVAGEVAA